MWVMMKIGLPSPSMRTKVLRSNCRTTPRILHRTGRATQTLSICLFLMPLSTPSILHTTTIQRSFQPMRAKALTEVRCTSRSCDTPDTALTRLSSGPSVPQRVGTEPGATEHRHQQIALETVRQTQISSNQMIRCHLPPWHRISQCTAPVFPSIQQSMRIILKLT